MSENSKRLWLSPLGSVRIFSYGTVESTNLLAREFAKAQTSDAVFCAKGQTAGRGRLGRSFCSDFGAGLYMSMLIHPKDRPSEAIRLTALAAVALCRAIEKNTGLSPSIKWVNDIQIKGKKIAGILAEGEFDERGGLKYAVVGIGVNLAKRDFGELSDIAAAIGDFAAEPPSAEALLRDTVREFYRIYRKREISGELEYYRRHSSVIGREITVYRGELKYPAQAIDIDGGFALIVQGESGVEALTSAEVSVRLPEQTDAPKHL